MTLINFHFFSTFTFFAFFKSFKYFKASRDPIYFNCVKSFARRLIALEIGSREQNPTRSPDFDVVFRSHKHYRRGFNRISASSTAWPFMHSFLHTKNGLSLRVENANICLLSINFDLSTAKYVVYRSATPFDLMPKDVMAYTKTFEKLIHCSGEFVTVH